ncbi:AAC(3)-I family aminoglycoside N-acetyltransferase [Lutibaculum baratangense]|uniref:N-acetyltransferase domain-containing protein n=1 Tax=Lutibaculum baratangense AMV1 TaxID=631454 RepID=V4RHE4_9HYPH|nr:AAC(3)-I family aminoglycoside N-acetyltransferase [Lutibaculum baratangense]ESR24774.1 hypothetical protein N177_2097 [Lutibaculum baratangense AMV1]
MRDDISIRRLALEDVPHLRELNALFATVFDDRATYSGRPPDDPYLRRLLAMDHVVVLVAVTEGRLVGGLVAYALDKFEQARREYYVYDLAVDAGFRRRGCATALLNELRRIAADAGGWVVFVQADHGDEPAIALYESLGTREEVLHFDLPVSARDGKADEAG